MINFEVGDSNAACGQKAASRGLCGWFSVYTQLLKLSKGRETWLTRQTSITKFAHAHGTLLTDIARTL
jgi:hypothetical protein